MALQLTPVHIFFATFPLFELAFFKRYWQPFTEHGGHTCASSLEAAAHMLYGSEASQVPWPEAVEPLVAQGDFRWLDLRVWSFRPESEWVDNVLGLPVNQTCIRGCYPAVCDFTNSVGGVPTCYSECHYDLEQRLTIFYLTVLGPIIGRLLLSIGLVCWHVKSELWKVESESASRDVTRQYSIIQFQAKCALRVRQHGGFLYRGHLGNRDQLHNSHLLWSGNASACYCRLCSSCSCIRSVLLSHEVDHLPPMACWGPWHWHVEQNFCWSLTFGHSHKCMRAVLFF